MKKFLTVLLALSVVFTYTVGTAFAANPTTYYVDDYVNALNAERDAQLGYLESDFNQVINGLTYDSEGYTADGYTKAAYQGTAKYVLDQLKDQMDTIIRGIVNTVPASGTTVAPSTKFADLQNAVYTKEAGHSSWAEKMFSEIMSGSVTDPTGLKVTAITESQGTLDRLQAPISLKALEDAIAAVNLNNYSTEVGNKTIAGVKVSNAEYVQYLIDVAEKVITDAANKTNAAKVNDYKGALTTFKADLATVKTIDDEKIDDEEAAKTVEGAVKAFVAYGIKNVYPVVSNVTTATFPMNLSSDATGKFSAFYTAKSGNTKATLFGVEVADINAVTKAEAVAINNALYDAINNAAAPVKVYAKTVADVVNLYDGGDTEFLQTLRNAMDVAAKYEEVVALGKEYKSTYKYGVKVYDDDAVDAAVKAAEALVYADLNKSKLDAAEVYLLQAAKNENLTLTAENYEYQKFLKALQEAKEKFYKNGTKNSAVTTKVSYGENKTPEEDLVYLQGTYASDRATKAEWTRIANNAIDALNDAESYDDITAALSAAKEALGGLILADDASDVAAAKTKYKAALTEYIQEQTKILGTDASKYSKALAAVRAKGNTLIDEAVTVAGVESAYADAQALVKNIVTDEKLDDMKKAVIALINALPYRANITLNSEAQIMDAYDAYMAYIGTVGAADFTESQVLNSAIATLFGLKEDALKDSLKKLKEELDDVDGGSDSAIAAYVAKKAEVEALVKEADDFIGLVDEINDTAAFKTVNESVSSDANYIALAGTLGASADTTSGLDGFWDREVEAVATALIKAAKDGATAEEMNAALVAFNALTDRQQYSLDASALQMAKLIKSRLINSVETLKITASSSAVKGKITVKWKVKGDAAGIDGYQVYKSKKAQTGYTFMGKTKKTSMVNKKNIKKGTRYFYKVRAYKVVDGVKYYSDWSNKANRIAK